MKNNTQAKEYKHIVELSSDVRGKEAGGRWSVHEYPTKAAALNMVKRVNENIHSFRIATYVSPEQQQAVDEANEAREANWQARKATLAASGWEFTTSNTGRPKANHPLHQKWIMAKEGFWHKIAEQWLTNIEAANQSLAK